MSSRDRKISIHMHPRLFAAMRELRVKQKESYSDIVNAALEAYLQQRGIAVHPRKDVKGWAKDL